MSMWDEYCLVCGGPPSVFFDEEIDTEGEEVGETEKDLLEPIVAADFKWLQEFVGISHKEDIIPLTSYNGYGAFSTNTTVHDMAQDEKYQNIFRIGSQSDDDDNYKNNKNNSGGIGEIVATTNQELHGYACHVKCFTLLQRDLGYTLRYHDVRPLLEDSAIRALNKFVWSDYGGFSEYQDHSFGRETQLVEEGKLWMLEDPTTIGSANARRILELWRPLVQNGFQRPGHATDGGANVLATEIIIAANTDEMDVEMIPKLNIQFESAGVVNADEMQDINVTIPIPKHDIKFESAGVEINADMELDTQSKRIGSTNAGDMDTKVIVEEVDSPTLQVGQCSQLTKFNPCE